jgi:hypothetical protein
MHRMNRASIGFGALSKGLRDYDLDGRTLVSMVRMFSRSHHLEAKLVCVDIDRKAEKDFKCEKVLLLKAVHNNTRLLVFRSGKFLTSYTRRKAYKTSKSQEGRGKGLIYIPAEHRQGDWGRCRCALTRMKQRPLRSASRRRCQLNNQHLMLLSQRA